MYFNLKIFKWTKKRALCTDVVFCTYTVEMDFDCSNILLWRLLFILTQ